MRLEVKPLGSLGSFVCLSTGPKFTRFSSMAPLLPESRKGFAQELVPIRTTGLLVRH
jgi:hypothetical protein